MPSWKKISFRNCGKILQNLSYFTSGRKKSLGGDFWYYACGRSGALGVPMFWEVALVSRLIY